MLGIYFSGTGNSKYAVEVFLREYDNDLAMFSIEDKNLSYRKKSASYILMHYKNTNRNGDV